MLYWKIRQELIRVTFHPTSNYVIDSGWSNSDTVSDFLFTKPRILIRKCKNKSARYSAHKKFPSYGFQVRVYSGERVNYRSFIIALCFNAESNIIILRLNCVLHNTPTIRNNYWNV